MAGKKSTEFSARRGKVVPLPMRSGATIDVEKLLLQGQSAPTVLVPKELQVAIDRRARALSDQAYALCREHLHRRVAFTCEVGYPERVLLMDKAFAVVSEGDLGDALLHEYKRKLVEIQQRASLALDLSLKFDDEIKSALKAQVHHG